MYKQDKTAWIISSCTFLNFDLEKTEVHDFLVKVNFASSFYLVLVITIALHAVFHTHPNDEQNLFKNQGHL